jgi:hypothetical protein
VGFHELKSLMVGVVLICGVMLAGPLTSQASPADPFAVSSAKTVVAARTETSPKPRVRLAERFSAMLSAPKVRQSSFDLTAISSQDFGDWDADARR